MKREYKVIMLLILVISIVALVLTSSYALFSFEEKGKIENKLVTGVYSSCEYEDGTTWNFDYTGSEQTFTVPCDGEYKLETWGAQGGSSFSYLPTYTQTAIGTNGAMAILEDSMKNQQKLYVNVGGSGENATQSAPGNGGYNGGGYGGTFKGISTGYVNCGGGGGSTDIRILQSDLTSRLIVAGGGAGAGGNAYQTLADVYALSNGNTTELSNNELLLGTTGGVYYKDGISGGQYPTKHYYGAGGGGYYGGQAGYTGTSKGNKITAGVREGNGYARITLVKADKPIKKYKEAILNGTDPVLKDNLIPIKIANDGTVSKADISKEWYKYGNKEWANAVILKDETKTYNNGDTIPEDNIESYFVWIPRYKYQIFDEGNYTGLTSIGNSVQTINIVFENKDTTPSNGTTKGSYLTHPAFTSFDSNGFWVGKFETGYDGATSTTAAEVNSVDTSKIIIKPNVYSWRSITVGNAFKNSYDYQRNLDSHMMKNTEWGCVAYLQHSVYGNETDIRVNNNSSYITGYAATLSPTKGFNNGTSIDGNRNESTALGVDGTYTVNYLNSKSGVASTTGNKSGIYDMSGGTWEYVMGYTINASTIGGSSGITSMYSDFFTNTNYSKYWDKYTSNSQTQFNNRILGDATGEMGPFGNEKDPDNVNRQKSSWYKDYAHLVYPSIPWFARGSFWRDGTGAGIFAFYCKSGTTYYYYSYRIALTPNS